MCWRRPGSEYEVDFWLHELGSAETVVDVQRHEMTEAELIDVLAAQSWPGLLRAAGNGITWVGEDGAGKHSDRSPGQGVTPPSRPGAAEIVAEAPGCPRGGFRRFPGRHSASRSWTLPDDLAGPVPQVAVHGGLVSLGVAITRPLSWTRGGPGSAPWRVHLAA